jgi:hypothetical protein
MPRAFIKLSPRRAARHVGRAMMLIRIQQKEGQSARGFSSLRKAICDGDRTGDKPVPPEYVKSQIDMLKRLGPEDMPVSTPLVRILLETVAVRYHGITEAEAWDQIGITRYRGHNLLWRGASITWPEWVVLVDSALGPGQFAKTKPLSEGEARRLRKLAREKRSKSAKIAAKTKRRNTTRRKTYRAKKKAHVSHRDTAAQQLA